MAYSGLFLLGLAFGLFQTVHRKAGEGIDAIRGTFTLIVVSALVLMIVIILTGELSLLWTAPFGAIVAFIIAGFIHFFVGWTLISISQEQIGAARTSAIVGTMPLFGLGVDVIVYQETFSITALLGIFLVVAGVYVISTK